MWLVMISDDSLTSKDKKIEKENVMHISIIFNTIIVIHVMITV